MKKNYTGWEGGCPLLPLSQLCSHPEGSLLSVESRWSMQTLIWGLSEGITVHTLPQCEWLVTYHKQEGQAVKHDREASAQKVHVPPSCSGKHTFGSFTSLCTTYNHPPPPHTGPDAQMHPDTWQTSYAICRKYIKQLSVLGLPIIQMHDARLTSRSLARQ